MATLTDDEKQTLDEVFRAITAVLYRRGYPTGRREGLAQIATDYMQEAMIRWPR